MQVCTFKKVFNGNVNKEELAKLKRKHKLYRKEELQQQTTIDDYLFWGESWVNTTLRKLSIKESYSIAKSNVNITNI